MQDVHDVHGLDRVAEWSGRMGPRHTRMLRVAYRVGDGDCQRITFIINQRRNE